jgi:hypothetical protein
MDDVEEYLSGRPTENLTQRHRVRRGREEKWVGGDESGSWVRFWKASGLKA